MSMSLLYISEQMTIYGGIILFVSGIIGNSINIFIFSSDRTYRRTPSSFYLLVVSIFNNLYIIINLSSRIVSDGYGIDLTRSSTIWCRTRQFAIGFLSLSSFSCSCLATIDQYLVTSRDINLRHLSKIKWAHRTVIIVIIVWCLHGIATFIFFDISPLSKTCVVTNTAYQIYLSIYILGLLCLAPVLTLIIFGSLTYENIRQTIVLAKEQADRQLTRMIFIQITLIVISMIPIGSLTVYMLITSNLVQDSNQLLKEYFLDTVFSLVSYLYYVGNFYMFFISSSRFRKTLKDRIFFWKRQNQINAINI